MSPIWRDTFKTTFEHKPIQVLCLVLKYKPFEVMRSGEKTEELRDNTAYWRCRMQDTSTGRWRDFNYVEFSLGFQPTSQQFRARFRGITIVNFVDRKYRKMLQLGYTFKRRSYITIGQLAAKVPRPSFTFEEKQLEMVTYFLEVVDDLMIETRYNVSQSSSFEIFMRARRAQQECIHTHTHDAVVFYMKTPCVVCPHVEHDI